MNLCTNASHAIGEEGGLLEVILSNVDLHSDYKSPYGRLGPGSYLRLSVRDTGHGMATETLERIFDPYFTTKDKRSGTGLGLAVVQGIIQSHDGLITVESAPERGTTFHVYLPLIRLEKHGEREIDEPLAKGHGRILFVDDEITLANLGKEILEHLGYDVISKTSSMEALELFQARCDDFDLVITDLTMPHMTGDKLAKELLKIRHDIPIILCTGYSERVSEGNAKEMGIKEFVMKPLVMRDLAKVIRKVLDED